MRPLVQSCPHARCSDVLDITAYSMGVSFSSACMACVTLAQSLHPVMLLCHPADGGKDFWQDFHPGHQPNQGVSLSDRS